MTRTTSRKRLTAVVVTAMTTSLLGAGAAAALPSTPSVPQDVVEEVPIVNAGFEEALGESGAIPGWSPDGVYDNQSYGVDDTRAHSGSNSLRIEDDNDVRALSILTDKFSVEPEVVYEASAMMSVERSEIGLYVRFFDEAGNRLTNRAVWQGTTGGDWQQLRQTITTPADAVTGALLINSSTIGTGVSNIDDVAMVATDEDPPGFVTDDPDVQEILAGDERISYLGTPVSSQIPGVPAVGVEDGRAVGYQMFKGIGDTEQPGTFVVFDLATGETLRTFPVDGVDNNWGIVVAADGRVYFATYHDYTLHRYDPETKTVENLGVIHPPDPYSAYPWDMAQGPGNTVFIGTFPHGDLWQYHPETDTFENWGHEGWGPDDPEQEQYIRGTAWDDATQDLLISTGSSDPAIYRIDTDTREVTRLTNDEKQPGLSDESFLQALSVVDGRIFARSYVSKKLLVVDGDGNTEYWGDARGTLAVGGRWFVPHPTNPDKVLFSNRQELWVYSLSDRTVAPTGANLGSYLSAAVVSPDDPNTLLGISGNATFVLDLDNPTEPTLHDFSFAQPTVLETVLTGPDNTMWAAGYMSSLSQVDTTGSGIVYPTIQISRQFESSIIRDGKMYLGAYGGSSFHVYDPSTPDVPPRELFRGQDVGFDRPITMVYDPVTDKAYMGSIPGYGKNQGGISVWDFDTKTVEHFTTEVVPEQGVASAVYSPSDGMIYLGSNVDGGNGAPDSGQTEAYLVVWDPKTDTKVKQLVPVPDRRGITGLTVGPDGRIWGIAEEYLFIYNPDTGQVEERVKLIGSRYGDGNRWSWGYMGLSAKDDMMYASLGNRLVRIDPDTLEVSNVGMGRGSRMHLDQEGNVYFIAFYGSQHLMKFEPTPAEDPGTCPDGDNRDTVWLRDIDTGVPNHDVGDGCTINDLIEDERDWDNHGAFVRHVGNVTADLVTDDVLTNRERATLIRAAASSHIGMTGDTGSEVIFHGTAETGENVLHIASLGSSVLGVDVAETPSHPRTADREGGSGRGRGQTHVLQRRRIHP